MNELFIQAIEIISEHPEIGILTEVSNVRVKLIKDYYTTYRFIDETIQIITIWDCRKNPDKFFEKIRNTNN